MAYRLKIDDIKGPINEKEVKSSIECFMVTRVVFIHTMEETAVGESQSMGNRAGNINAFLEFGSYYAPLINIVSQGTKVQKMTVFRTGNIRATLGASHAPVIITEDTYKECQITSSVLYYDEDKFAIGGANTNIFIHLSFSFSLLRYKDNIFDKKGIAKPSNTFHFSADTGRSK